MLADWTAKFGSLLFMAIALGLDGFSISLGIGLQNIRFKRIAIIGLVIGLFHVLLPFLGIIIGHFIFESAEYIATVVGGTILVTIGAYMIFSAFQTKPPFIINPKGISLISLSLIVSLDSFPVGVSLGLLGMKMLFIIFLFGIVATLLAWLGMLVGKKTNHLLGTYSEVLGGLILSSIGIQMIFL